MNKMMGSMGFMLLITLFFTSLVSVIKISNNERIEQNRQAKLQRSVLQVLGIAVEDTSSPEALSQLFDKRIETITHQNRNIYLGYEVDGKTIRGYAFPVGGPGFWGPIYGMVAVNPNASKILGISFYKHSETPGLGGRISEDWFSKQFKGLPLHPVTGDKKIFYLTPMKPEKPADELDAITGATGTSRAVEKFLNEELSEFLAQFRNAGDMKGNRNLEFERRKLSKG